MLDFVSTPTRKVRTHTDAILLSFAQCFDIPIADRYEIIQAIDEWWFVPRSEEMTQHALKRVDTAYKQYMSSGTLPDYIHKASAYINGERHAHVVSILARKHELKTAL